MNGLPWEFGPVDPRTGQVQGMGRFHNASFGAGGGQPQNTTAGLPPIPTAQMPPGTPGTGPQQAPQASGGGGDAELALALLRAQQRASRGMRPPRGFGGEGRFGNMLGGDEDFTPFSNSDQQFLRQLFRAERPR